MASINWSSTNSNTNSNTNRQHIDNKVLFITLNYLLLVTMATGSSALTNVTPPTSSALQQITPCSAVNSTSNTLPCVTRNNCSGRQHSEGCIMVLSLPPSQLDPELLDQHLADALNLNLEKPSSIEVWTMGCISVGIISLSGITGAVLWPFINTPLYKYIMAVLIGLAVGSLTSTALFQLLPEAFKLPSSTLNENYLNTAVFSWFSIWIFFVIETITKLAFRKSKEQQDLVNPVIINRKDENVPLKDRLQDTACHEHQVLTKLQKEQKISAVAWMIIFGDGLHNFIDGMTIGAGYSQSIATGIGLSIAIACEEFPHELGDFAILLQSGMSVTRAICYNFLSACTAFIGLVLGILLGQLEESNYVFAFAGGLFLYISLTHLMPELKCMLKVQLKQSRTHCLVYIILQNFGILLGATLIYFITKYNDMITDL